jgi:hypothetical protein
VTITSASGRRQTRITVNPTTHINPNVHRREELESSPYQETNQQPSKESPSQILEYLQQSTSTTVQVQQVLLNFVISLVVESIPMNYLMIASHLQHSEFLKYLVQLRLYHF